LSVSSINQPNRYPANLPPFASLVGGQYHTLSVSADGRMFGFGGNVDGQLGTTGFEAHDTPVQITAIPESVNQVAAGGAHSLAISSSGRLYTFGRNSQGQLCRGAMGGSDPTPAVVTSVGSVVSACGGFAHSAIVKADGTVYTCGLNSDGQLGLGDFQNRAAATQISGISSAVAVSCGAKHTFVVTNNNGQYSILAFGSNSHGQLCQTIQPRMITFASPIVVVTFPYAGTYVNPSLGLYHSVFGVPAAQSVHAVGCGSNQYGQLGNVGVGTDVGTDGAGPVALVAGQDVAKLVAGSYHTAILTTSGVVYVFGRNYDGQLGLGSNDLAVAVPAIVSSSATGLGGGGGITAFTASS